MWWSTWRKDIEWRNRRAALKKFMTWCDRRGIWTPNDDQPFIKSSNSWASWKKRPISCESLLITYRIRTANSRPITKIQWWAYNQFFSGIKLTLLCRHFSRIGWTYFFFLFVLFVFLKILLSAYLVVVFLTIRTTAQYRRQGNVKGKHLPLKSDWLPPSLPAL